MKVADRILLFIFTAVMSAAAWGAAPSTSITQVTTEPAFCNPSLGQKATIRFTLARAGRVSLSILDRDRFLIRKLEPFDGVAGQNAVSWDGKDDGGTLVPNEAYNIRIEVGGGTGDAYDPSENFHPVIEEPPNRIYSRADGVLRYELSRPSRVHAQAGQATVDPKTKQPEGPVLKTIVDRQPRTAGGVVENWNGFDESGKIYVPDLPHFVVAVFATSLPESSIITVGNRKQTFLAYARSHRPAEKQRVRAMTGEGHAHHTGLNEFEDHSPTLEIRTTPPAADGIVRVEAGHDLQLRLSLDPDRGPYFLKQPNDFDVYLGERSVVHRAAPQNSATVTIPARLLTLGEHVVAVNWGSRLGPVAVNALRVIVVPGG
jgi:hypothetical protein